MVLGLSAKNRKDATVHVDYLIHIQEIKPWPPSESLRSLRSVMIQWENGDRNSGSTKAVVPSLGSVVGEGRIEFNESFRLPVTLVREMNIKNKDAATFQKNFLEFNLYEPRREKTQLLATAIVNLSDYGIVKETLSLNVPMNSKRNYKNTAQPVLIIKIQRVDKAVSRTGSSLTDGLSKDASLDKNGGESVSSLMHEEYAEEAEVASFTDDDVSSHSSLATSSSAVELNNDLPPQNEKTGLVKSSDSRGGRREHDLASKLLQEKSNIKPQISSHENQRASSSRFSSIDLCSELESLVNGNALVFDSPNSSSVIPNNVEAQNVTSLPSFANGHAKRNTRMGSDEHEDLPQEVQKKEHDLASKLLPEKSNIKPHIPSHENQRASSSRSSSIDLCSELESLVNGNALVFDSANSASVIPNNVAAQNITSLPSFSNGHAKKNTNMRSDEHEDLPQEVQKKFPNGQSANNGDAEQNSQQISSNHFLVGKIDSKKIEYSQVNGKDDEKTCKTEQGSMDGAAKTDDDCNSLMEDMKRMEQDNSGLEREKSEQKRHSLGGEALNFYSLGATSDQISPGNDSLSSSRENFGMMGNILKSDRLKHVKSVRSSPDMARGNGLDINNHNNEVKENGFLGDSQNIVGSFGSSERKDAKVYPKDTKSAILEGKIQQLEHKIKTLEAELREAAAAEAALYSVVAEHGSSMSKVHAPARRLSRLYLHACKENSQSRRASAAKSAISGLVLVAKACGNDVPRLTFWLSNSVVLRTIISQATGDLEQPFSAHQSMERNGDQSGNNKISSPLKWEESSPGKKGSKDVVCGGFGDLDDPQSFLSALQKVEAWIFSRTVESIWWQILTPLMQSAATKAVDRGPGSDSRKNLGRTCSSRDQDQVNFSLGHWKKAFKDACERLCPVRAGGHECGCLHLLVKLIMEQCVARLDVAMFNAILRESDDEIPTDPVSDPISDFKVLPIPAGKSSFGAGAQLKNAIGSWSRFLSDLIGMDDDELPSDDNEDDEDDERHDASFKSFRLLNALSDLMMLPKDMLLSRSVRKEVCPTFGVSLIKRVVENFVPDEFCPDPIPKVVLEALEDEDSLECGEESITNFPCTAAPPLYVPPSVDSVSSVIGEFGSPSQLRRSGSSVVRKANTSDDELDELNSPLTSILIDGSRSSPFPSRPSWISRGNNSQNAIRYELLRDIWMSCE
ncbi:uncharacterized protein LOC123196340 [Mangifera indica]|uniref:uncharacterized protein LOC123196340 n=1 Tax=Mangifera indica TaxID=29780 RepID=UPI001CFB94E8|nr:uncharacterized protein LOC123196340 [Mangifera indica]XP_044466264.1 uncharacterized protein LOC123196340 [Mangifera indica]XP_044466265.1 uncharacterized protein LOC123196340 [Mangifera indica]XP_044466267.1 uncharacterized protein LOC123196340 [Mangifera indica]